MGFTGMGCKDEGRMTGTSNLVPSHERLSVFGCSAVPKRDAWGVGNTRCSLACGGIRVLLVRDDDVGNMVRRTANWSFQARAFQAHVPLRW